MKNKLTYTGIIIFIFSLQIIAQEVVVNLDSGINVAIISKTTPLISEREFGKHINSFVNKVKNENSIIKQMVDYENKTVFEYRLEVAPDPNSKKYKVTIKSSNTKLPTIDQYPSYKRQSLPKYPDSISVNDGDTIILDILENPKTKARIQDLIKITREHKTDKGYFLEFEEPRDFTLNDVQFQLMDYEIYINEKLVRHIEGNTVSEFIGVIFSGKGAFVLSPFNNKQEGLRKIGIIEDNKIIIKHNGDLYKIISKVSILGNGKKWNLWGIYLPPSKNQSRDSNAVPLVTVVGSPNLKSALRIVRSGN